MPKNTKIKMTQLNPNSVYCGYGRLDIFGSLKQKLTLRPYKYIYIYIYLYDFKKLNITKTKNLVLYVKLIITN